MALAVCTWNLFHGRASEPVRANLIDRFAAALGSHPWDVAGLQEVPPWWAVGLGRRLEVDARSARTSLARAWLEPLQEQVHRRNPELLGVDGASANVLLVRPSAGRIVDHRRATLRRLPQGRSVHAARLERPDGSHWWVANVHTHNRPESRAAADTIDALRLVDRWSAGEPAVLIGDLNLQSPRGLARVEGWELLHGHRVDHVLGRGLRAAGRGYAALAPLGGGVVLSDHRIVGVPVTPI